MDLHNKITIHIEDSTVQVSLERLINIVNKASERIEAELDRLTAFEIDFAATREHNIFRLKTKMDYGYELVADASVLDAIKEAIGREED